MRNAALTLGIIAGIFGMIVGFFSYGYTVAVQEFGEIDGLAEQVSNVNLIRGMAVIAPVLAIAGGAMAWVAKTNDDTANTESKLDFKLNRNPVGGTSALQQAKLARRNSIIAVSLLGGGGLVAGTGMSWLLWEIFGRSSPQLAMDFGGSNEGMSVQWNGTF